MVDHYPMLWACFCLLDKVTLGEECEQALDEVCAHLNLNHAQRHVLKRAFDVLCGQDIPVTVEASHHGVHWG